MKLEKRGRKQTFFGLLGFHALQEAPSCDFFLVISALPSDNSRDSLFQLHIYTGGAAAAVHDFCLLACVNMDFTRSQAHV